MGMSREYGTNSMAVRLARVVRQTEAIGLTEETRKIVKAMLLAELGFGVQQEQPAVAKPKTVVMPQTAPEQKILQRPKQRSEIIVPEPKKDETGTPEIYEMKIRQLVEANVAWAQIAPYAWNLYALLKTPEIGAKIVELAYLHGELADVSTAMEQLRNSGCKKFYTRIHEAVRLNLVARMWHDPSAVLFATQIYAEKNAKCLTPLERLFVFCSIAQSADQTQPYMYYRRFRRFLLSAVDEYGEQVGVLPGKFRLMVGKMAADVGTEEETREILGGILPADSEYNDALQILLDATVEKNKAKKSHYTELLLAEQAVEQRITLLKTFLDATRGLGGYKDRNRPALNEILKDPLKWVPKEAEAWAALSELLIANRDLEPLLPNLMQVFRTNANVFNDPVVDGALWQGPLGIETGESPRDVYWQGIGLLHQYISCGFCNESALWMAKKKIAEAMKGWMTALPFSWTDLHKAAVRWVSKTHYIREGDRLRMLKQLRIAADIERVTSKEIEQYIEQVDAPPVEILNSLQRIASKKQLGMLEAKIIMKRGSVYHLTNADLNRVWQVAAETRQSDLCWRTATTIKSRRALIKQVSHTWEISGENRAHYPLLTVDEEIVRKCYQGFSKHGILLANACLTVGPILPELLAMLDKGARSYTPSTPVKGSAEFDLERYLNSQSWLNSKKKRYRFSYEGIPTAGVQAPAFAQIMPNNGWSLLVAKLCERFGINSWNWKLSVLRKQIVDLVPMLANRREMKRHSGKVARWLKNLTPEQRNAWVDLSSLAKKISDEEAETIMASFVCRLATVIYQNHFVALESLKVMRAPIDVLWNTENWILSSEYTEVRKQLGTSSMAIVPNALQRIGSIVDAS